MVVHVIMIYQFYISVFKHLIIRKEKGKRKKGNKDEGKKKSRQKWGS